MDPVTITAAISAVVALIEYIGKVRTNLDQNAELTEAQRADLKAQIDSIPSLPHWQVND